MDPENDQRTALTLDAGETGHIGVPRSERRIAYNALQRVGIGVTRLGTSEVVAIGAHACAPRRLDANL